MHLFATIISGLLIYISLMTALAVIFTKNLTYRQFIIFTFVNLALLFLIQGFDSIHTQNFDLASIKTKFYSSVLCAGIYILASIAICILLAIPQTLKDTKELKKLRRKNKNITFSEAMKIIKRDRREK